MALFSLGSLLCALAPNLELLICFRVVQAIGGAMLSPVAMSIVRNVFEDPRERARAIGVFASMFGISMALGPVLGGVLVSAFSWRAVFLVTLPLALAAIALTHSVRARISSAATPANGSGRPGSGDRGSRRHHLRDHRWRRSASGESRFWP